MSLITVNKASIDTRVAVTQALNNTKDWPRNAAYPGTREELSNALDYLAHQLIYKNMQYLNLVKALDNDGIDFCKYELLSIPVEVFEDGTH